MNSIELEGRATVSDNLASGEESWPWPDSLDALAAAPEYHHVLLENEGVRVLDVRISKGTLSPCTHITGPLYSYWLVTENIYAVMLTAQFCSTPAPQKRKVSCSYQPGPNHSRHTRLRTSVGPRFMSSVLR